MNKPFFKIILVGLFAILASCSTTPESCFTIDKDKANIKVDEDIHFFPSCSKDAQSFRWDFGDGNTKGEAEPKHKYSRRGSYDVTLTVFYDDNSAQTTQTLNVY